PERPLQTRRIHAARRLEVHVRAAPVRIRSHCRPDPARSKLRFHNEIYTVRPFGVPRRRPDSRPERAPSRLTRFAARTNLPLPPTLPIVSAKPDLARRRPGPAGPWLRRPPGDARSVHDDAARSPATTPGRWPRRPITP